jgi:light-regulated signal transduction histidine kinase (bacteriophytochrome)
VDNLDASTNKIEPADVTALDLTQCEREPIRIPGSVQPHGILLVLTARDMIVVSVSANSERHLGLTAQEMIGRPLVELIGAEALQILRESLARADDSGHHGTDVRFASNGSRWTGVAHAQGDLVLLELEPPRPTTEGDSALVLVGGAAKRMQAATSDIEACQIAAQQVRRITGFDRVKVYRFASDWSGEVIGEARDPAMASYLGLHFPPSDIPAQARTLYQTNPMRLIAQVDYTPSPLVPDHDPSTGAPFDLSQVVLRSVSPIHLEYLRNMEVGASMSVSILKSSALEGNSLWGLIACHHRKPLHVGFEVRQACELVAQVLSWQLGVMERIEITARFGKVKTLHADLLGKAFSGFSVAEGLARKGEAALEIVDATGFAMVTPEGVLRVGETPDESFIVDLANWLVIPDRSDFFATDRLPMLFPPAVPYRDRNGVSCCGSGPN